MNTHTSETRAMTHLRQFLRDTWRLARPYWSSEDRWAARSLLAVVVAMNLGLVYINVLLNKWQNTFFNAVQEKNAEVFFHQLWVFTELAAVFIAVAVYQLYLNQMLQIRWRRWLTDRYLNAWLSDRTYYRMQLMAGDADNPDQRIAFARALIQKPDWLFLDEATSAVDETTEQRLYALVEERLAGTTVISIGHRPTLGAFHDRRLVVRPNSDRAASLEETKATP